METSVVGQTGYMEFLLPMLVDSRTLGLGLSFARNSWEIGDGDSRGKDQT